MPKDSGYSHNTHNSHATHASVKNEVTKNFDMGSHTTKSGYCPTCGQKVSASNVGGASVGGAA